MFTGDGRITRFEWRAAYEQFDDREHANEMTRDIRGSVRNEDGTLFFEPHIESGGESPWGISEIGALRVNTLCT